MDFTIESLFPASDWRPQPPPNPPRAPVPAWRAPAFGVEVRAVTKSEARARVKAHLSAVRGLRVRRLPAGTVVERVG